MIPERSDFYVYLHREADTGRPFYVGKGCEHRRSRSDGRNSWWKRIVKKHGFTHELMADGLTEKLSYEFEELAIASIPGLCNLSTGGIGGSSGRKMSDEHRQRFLGAARLSNLGRKQSAETVAKRISKNTGKKRSDEFKVRMSMIHTGGKQKFVQCVETGEKFISLGKAAEWMQSIGHKSVDRSNIARVLSGKRSKCHGLHWVRCN